jgi:hypothetical protein
MLWKTAFYNMCKQVSYGMFYRRFGYFRFLNCSILPDYDVTWITKNEIMYLHNEYNKIRIWTIFVHND